MMKPRNPDYANQVRQIFSQCAFVQDLGISLKEMGPGWCETGLKIQARYLQQDNVVHAGVQATLADHTAGAAGSTLIGPDEIILTAEFKVNFLRPAHGVRLECRAQVLKPGRRLIVAESEVFAIDDGREPVRTAKAMVTLVAVDPLSGS